MEGKNNKKGWLDNFWDWIYPLSGSVMLLAFVLSILANNTQPAWLILAVLMEVLMNQKEIKDELKKRR